MLIFIQIISIKLYTRGNFPAIFSFHENRDENLENQYEK